MKQLATSALRHSPASLSLAVSGVLGPEEDEDGNPVGLVYFCCMKSGQEPVVVKEEFGKEKPEQLLHLTIARAFDLINPVLQPAPHARRSLASRRHCQHPVACERGRRSGRGCAASPARRSGRGLIGRGRHRYARLGRRGIVVNDPRRDIYRGLLAATVIVVALDYGDLQKNDAARSTRLPATGQPSAVPLPARQDSRRPPCGHSSQMQN